MAIFISIVLIILSFVFLLARFGLESIIFTIISVINFYFIAVFYLKTKELQVRMRQRMPEEVEGLIENLSEKSGIDGLTGVFNRSSFDKYFSEVYRKFKLNGELFFIVFFDIDHFKDFNDIYGHEAGDTVLRSFAQGIFNNIRKDEDKFFRFGGEEFVLIVRKCKVPLVQEAELIIKKLRKVVEDLTIPGLPKITCSIGVGFPDDVKNRQEILKEADENMYLAKENGRNRAYINKNTVII